MNNQLAKKQFLFVRLLILNLLFCSLCLLIFPSFAQANTLPTRIWNIPNTNSHSYSNSLLLPDWSQITFQNLPAITSNGVVETEEGRRSWNVGDNLETILRLADIKVPLNASILSLELMEELALNSMDLDNLPLSSFPLVGKQNISHLIEIVPNLAQLKLGDVAPLLTLASHLLSNREIPNIESLLQSPIAQVISEFPLLGESSLNQIDLSEFALTEIPNLVNVSLEEFIGWEEELLTNIPNFNRIPLANFPNAVTEVGNTVMRIDMIYSQAEKQRTNTVSGSDLEGFSVDCEENCAYIELDDLENIGNEYRHTLEGKQWISGKYQKVRGGHGCLASINDGKEPTGRHPFGSLFKVVVEEPNEKTDTVDTALYFRFSNFCGHTPYFIGPIPFFSYRVNSPLFVGNLPNNSMVSFSNSFTSSTESTQVGENLSSVFNSESASHNQDLVASTYIEGVDIVELANAISAFDGSNSRSYQFTGNYVCVKASDDCGIPLGKYHLMSNNNDVKASIASVSGGDEFLTRISNGIKPTPSEVFQYFPPLTQNKLFRESLAQKVITTSQQIDVNTGQPFKGDRFRLIARVAQKHYGGAASKVDSNLASINGGYSLADYGKQVAQLYHQKRVSSLNPSNKSKSSTFSTDIAKNNLILASFNKNSLIVLKILLSSGLLKLPSLLGYRLSRFNYRFCLGLGVILSLVVAWIF